MKSSPDELVQVKKGSSTPSEVVIRDMDQFDMHLWLEMYDPPADDALEILGSVCGSRSEPCQVAPGSEVLVLVLVLVSRCCVRGT